jgi:Helix-loop-helix DNA-binding domain
MDKKKNAVADTTASSNKRERESDNDGSDELDDLPAGAFAQMTRSERKRHREKKRRSDVNKGFDDLISLLWEIDPTMRADAEERAPRLQLKAAIGGPPETLLSRVDLISRAVQLLRRLHRENEQNKAVISTLARQRGMERSLNLDAPNLGSIAGINNLDRSTLSNDEVRY